MTPLWWLAGILAVGVLAVGVWAYLRFTWAIERPEWIDSDEDRARAFTDKQGWDQ